MRTAMRQPVSFPWCYALVMAGFNGSDLRISLPSLNDIQAVYVEVLQLIDLPTQPPDVNGLHLLCATKTEVESKIILRVITATAS